MSCLSTSCSHMHTACSSLSRHADLQARDDWGVSEPHTAAHMAQPKQSARTNQERIDALTMHIENPHQVVGSGYRQAELMTMQVPTVCFSPGYLPTQLSSFTLHSNELGALCTLLAELAVSSAHQGMQGWLASQLHSCAGNSSRRGPSQGAQWCSHPHAR